MSEDPIDERDARSEPIPTEEWIEKLAESEDIGRDEVLERLVSSYWTLKEMHGLMDQTEEGLESGSGEPSIDIEALYASALPEELDGIVERVDRLEDEVADADAGVTTSAFHDEIESLSQRIDDVEGALVGRQDSIETRLDDEFENLETILDYLIETTDSLSDRLESLADGVEGAQRWRETQARLTDLKHLASRLDVRWAKCEYCDTKVDVALLSTPVCPQCDREFTDIEPGRSWFGLGSHTLKVTGEPYLDDTTQRDERTGQSDGGADGPPTDGDEFVWGDDRD